MGATRIEPKATSPWTGFNPGLWQKEINVRDFIQQNSAPGGTNRSRQPLHERVGSFRSVATSG